MEILRKSDFYLIGFFLWLYKSYGLKFTIGCRTIAKDCRVISASTVNSYLNDLEIKKFLHVEGRENKGNTPSYKINKKVIKELLGDGSRKKIVRG